MSKCLVCEKEYSDCDDIFVCEECDDLYSKIQIMKKISSAKEKLEYAYNRYRIKKVSFSEEAHLISKKINNSKHKYRSTEEIMFAMQLMKEKIDFRPNVKIEQYTVDFVLPDYCMIIEIDGELYHKKEVKEKLREYDLRKFAVDCDIIRIPASFIPNYVTFGIDALIKYVLEKREINGRKYITDYDSNYISEFYKKCCNTNSFRGEKHGR